MDLRFGGSDGCGDKQENGKGFHGSLRGESKQVAELILVTFIQYGSAPFKTSISTASPESKAHRDAP
jgi:hypothetical protein